MQGKRCTITVILKKMDVCFQNSTREETHFRLYRETRVAPMNGDNGWKPVRVRKALKVSSLCFTKKNLLRGYCHCGSRGLRRQENLFVAKTKVIPDTSRSSVGFELISCALKLERTAPLFSHRGAPLTQKSCLLESSLQAKPLLSVNTVKGVTPQFSDQISLFYTSTFCTSSKRKFSEIAA